MSPSILHEALVHLFRNNPALAIELVGDALGLKAPGQATAQIAEASLPDIIPAEYRADVVVLVYVDLAGVKTAIAVEIQLACEPTRRFAWPLYAASLRARHRTAACVLVFTPDPVVAAWAAEPIEIGPPGCRFVPLVVGPKEIPRVTDLETARRSPELAVLSTLCRYRHNVDYRPSSTRSTSANLY